MTTSTLIQFHPSELTAVIQTAVAAGIQQALKNLEKDKYPDFPHFMNRKQTAQLLNVSVRTVDTWTVQGRLTQYLCENVKRYKKHEIIDFLKTYG